MNNLELLEVESQQLHRDPSQRFVNQIIECLAHREYHENDGDVYDGYGGARNAQSLLSEVKFFLLYKSLKNRARS